MTITNTCDGAGVGEGSALGAGEVWIAAGGVGLGCIRSADAGPQAAAITTASIGAAMKLVSKRWEMDIRPERGGRITSLRLDGEEILDQGIGVDQPTAKSFVESGAWGWDEMVPNVEATDTLPDNGEAWRMSWEVPYLSRHSVFMRATGRLVPWILDRTIELTDQLRLS